MNNIKKFIKTSMMLNKLDIKYAVLFFIPIVFLSGKNNYLDIILVIYSTYLCFILNIKQIFPIYIFMSFFEEVTVMPLLNGSVSRVIMVILLLKLVRGFIKGNTSLNKAYIYIASFFIISLILGFVNHGFDFSEISIILNVIIILLFGGLMKNGTIGKDISMYKKIIVYATFIAILHGLLHFSFLQEVTANLTNMRFKGTYEPNFMSLFINMAITVILFDKEKIFDVKEKLLIMLVLLTGLYITVSMTGYITLLFIIICKIWEKNGVFIKKTIKRKKGCFFVLAIIMIMTTGLTIVQFENNISKSTSTPDQEETNNRFVFLYQTLKKGDLNTLTSGRFSIAQNFIEASIERDVPSILFGNGPSSKTVFSEFFGRQKYAHNSYIDFIYSFGFVGFMIVCFYLIFKIKNREFLGVKLDRYDSIQVIRCIMLIAALTLSLYSKRIILFLFIL